jgi:hypothetical protein
MTVTWTKLSPCVVLTAAALPLTAAGCSGTTIVGVSGQQGVEMSTPLSAPAITRTATEISNARPDEVLNPEGPALGDIDGDGYDDFLLSGSRIGALEQNVTAYLFYGRPVFPATLSSSDADASFEAGVSPSFALGDLNGDGLADFALHDYDGVEIILGTTTRWSGHHAKFSTGSVLTVPAEPIVFDENGGYTPGPVGVPSRLGDLNGDGKDDFSVSIDLVRDPGMLNAVDYIIAGRDTGWPTGVFDPSMAVAQLGYAPLAEHPEVTLPMSITRTGDLDGDGNIDLLAMGASSVRVFYGEAGGFRGVLTPEQASAELLGTVDFPLPIGDVDGDGADDLVVQTPGQLGIVYGSPTRLSGRLDLTPDVTFSVKGPFLSHFLDDNNGDGLPDLVFQGFSTANPNDMILYVVYGTGTRLTGEQGDKAQVFQPRGYIGPDALDTGGFYSTSGGDFDGDGSTDLILGTPSRDGTSNVTWLLPGAMLEPE